MSTFRVGLIKSNEEIVKLYSVETEFKPSMTEAESGRLYVSWYNTRL